MGKVLVLGGKPIGSVEICQRLKEQGHYVIVTDFLPRAQSPAKLIADESWDISTGDIDKLTKKVQENNINGIVSGVHEFNITQMVNLAQATGLPCYCTPTTRIYGNNKTSFKNLCIENNIPVAKTYSLKQLKNVKNDDVFPVIVKPVDGSGSRGFHICNNIDELEEYYTKAATFSPTATVLIEKYIPFDSVIIHYTLINGKCHYSGMSDKKSVKFKNSGASVMGIQIFPSKGEKCYLEKLNDRVIKMFEEAGFTNGPLWIEAFFDGDTHFIFNEMGYRFGGSLTYYPVKYFYGIDQMDLMISQATGGKISQSLQIKKPENKRKYCILPIHIKPGVISVVNHNLNRHDIIEDLYAVVPVHFQGDEILEWGSAQQVYAYLHILYDDIHQLRDNLHKILNNIQVLDQSGQNMIYTLFNINDITS